MTRRSTLFSLLLAACLALPAPALAEPELLLGLTVERMHIAFPQDPEQTWFLDTFGFRRANGHTHRGVDLHAPKGSPVYAVAPGVVTRAGVSARSGYHVVIDHGSGWTSWYMHLDNDAPGTDNGRGGPGTAFAPGLVEGSFVDAGQLIGHVGDSGNAEATEPHTHLEIHRNGRQIDPYPMLVQAQRRAYLALHAQRVAALAPRLQ